MHLNSRVYLLLQEVERKHILLTYLSIVKMASLCLKTKEEDQEKQLGHLRFEPKSWRV